MLSRVVMAAILSMAIQDAPAERDAWLEFQRAADRYAFEHRQVDRRQVPPPANHEGALFSPRVQALVRERLRSRPAGCDWPTMGDFAVPAINASSVDTTALPPCVTSLLPKLPAELEYRAAGIALVLADAHRHIVVDLTHAAVARRD